MSAVIVLTSFLLFFFFAFIITLIKYQDERRKNLRIQGEFHPYSRKPHFLTGNEKKLFSVLQDLDSLNDTYIFPQLHLSTLLKVNNEAKDMQGKFEWLNKLYVDFVIFDKQNIEPLLVIELNDSTHKWNFRKSRDQFVKTALEENQLPLLVVETKDLAKTEEFEKKINQLINTPLK